MIPGITITEASMCLHLLSGWVHPPFPFGTVFMQACA